MVCLFHILFPWWTFVKRAQFHMSAVYMDFCYVLMVWKKQSKISRNGNAKIAPLASLSPAFCWSGILF
jgi:hypothetical protein